MGFSIILLKEVWLCRPLIPALRRQRQVDLCDFKASLVYIASSRQVRTTQQTNTKNIKVICYQKNLERVFFLKNLKFISSNI